MRRLLLLAVSFISFTAYCQGEKDSLLVRDYGLLKEKYTLMNYLEKAVSNYYFMDNDALRLKIRNDFPVYYEGNILANNPSDINISAYLGFAKSKRPTVDEFIEAVTLKNGNTLLDVFKTYGYTSAIRQEKVGIKDKIYIELLIIDKAPDDVRRKIFRVLKQEYKNGNLTTVEFEYVKQFAKHYINSTKSYERFQAKIEALKSKEKAVAD